MARKARINEIKVEIVNPEAIPIAKKRFTELVLEDYFASEQFEKDMETIGKMNEQKLKQKK